MLMAVALWIVLPTLALAGAIALIRLLRGPSLPDRVIALDLLATICIGIIAVYGGVTNQPAFLDVALVVALLSFLGTAAFARYVERSR